MQNIVNNVVDVDDADTKKSSYIGKAVTVIDAAILFKHQTYEAVTG